MKGGDCVNTPQEIANIIKTKALDKGLKLGAMLSDIGVGESTLRNMRNLGCMPSIETLIKFAVYLDCSLDDLCGTENKKPKRNRKQKNNAASDDVRNDVIKMIKSASTSELERIRDMLMSDRSSSE